MRTLALGLVRSSLLLFAMLVGQTTLGTEVVQSRFVGSWQLVEWSATDTTGSAEFPFGADAIGLISYASDGHMSVQMMRRDSKPFASSVPAEATSNEKANMWQNYLAYFGTYSIDPARSTITHELVGCTFPNWNGTRQTRSYTFSNDTLTLVAKTANGKTHRIVWRRNEVHESADGE